MLCVWSEAPDVKTLDITDEINRHISASIIRYRFTQNTQECLICPNSSGCMLDCNIVIQIAPFASFLCVITTFKGWGFFWFFVLASNSDSAPASVHRHRFPLIQSLLCSFHQNGQAAVRHVSLLHGAHQLRREQERTEYVACRTTAGKVNLSKRGGPLSSGRNNYLQDEEETACLAVKGFRAHIPEFERQTMKPFLVFMC